MTGTNLKKKLLFPAAVYIAILGYLLFLAPFRDNTLTEINLVPLSNIGALTAYTFSSGSDWWHWFINIPGNILAFIPAGALLFVYGNPLPKGIPLLIAALIPTLVEVLQLVLQTGSCDIDDILLNASGILTGYRLTRFTHK